MRVVQTMLGIIPRDQLQVAVLLAESPGGLVVTAEWRKISDGPNGEFVKRDAHTVVYAEAGDQAQAAASGLGKVVFTSRGLIPRDALQVSVIQDEGDNYLAVITEWRVKAEGPDAPHVRRDVFALAFANPETQLMASLGQLPMAALAPAAQVKASNDVTIGLVGQSMGIEQHKFA